MAYIGVVIDQYGKIPLHVRDANQLVVYDLSSNSVRERHNLVGIGDAYFPGIQVAMAAMGNGIETLYTGRELNFFTRFPMRVLGINNKAAPNQTIDGIVSQLSGNSRLDKAA
ncbi:MAG: hypothetical protein KKC75_01780 [Nanoarchaeota archaeon]|nr:hypothetical protein [Nanoarchaeota archaeon]MBU1005735.1 hypothetical protein [Nanoarchaeota archaeon]MBU1945580.1 hypothetical protein [Nanoarchaeota archaeon]